jgi:hypothetical protein
MNINGSIPINPFVPNPTITSVTATGAGTSSVTYKIVAVAADGTMTAASAGTTDATGPDAFDDSDFETIVWTDPAHADHILVYRTAGGPSQGLIATVAAAVGTFVDNGVAAVVQTPSAANGTGIGAAIIVDGAAGLAVQLDGTFTATIQFQGKIGSASGWVNIGAAQTAVGILDVTATAKSLSMLRAKMTAYTSGAPAAYYQGS